MCRMDNLFAKVGGWRSGTGTKFVTRSGKTSDPTKQTTGSMFSGMNAPDRTPTKTPGWTFRRLFVILGNLDSIDLCDWKFVDFFRVPRGPWAIYGDNNGPFVRLRRPKSTSVAAANHSVVPF